MAGGKETPRQKMIGMMYLVLTALLALNVAKSILDAFVAIEENIQKANLTELYRGNEKRAELKETMADKSNPQRAKKAEMLIRAVNEIDNMTAKRIKMIDDLKLEILKSIGEDVETVAPDNAIIISKYSDKEPLKPTRMNLSFVNGKDKYDDPMRIMLGSQTDIKNPSGKGFELWKSLISYRKELTEKIASTRIKYVELNDSYVFDEKYNFKAPAINAFKDQMDLDKKIKGAIKESKVHPQDRDGIAEIYRSLTKEEKSEVHGMSDVHWIGKTFDHSPAVAAIASLSSLQKDILNARALAVTMLRGRVSGDNYSFSEVFAMAYGPEVVNQGDKFDLHVMMVAFDPDMQPEVMMGDESIDNVKEGRGKISLTASGNRMELSGTISIRNKSGLKTTMPWKKEVIVMSPSGSIEMPQLNVLYRGYDNIVNATASGYPETILNATGATTARSGENYIVKPTGSGRKAYLSVSGKSADGRMVQLKRIEYRVMNLPKPSMYMGAVKEDGRVNALDPKLFLRYDETIPLTAKFNMVNWEISVPGAPQPAKGSGNRLNARAVGLINAARSGDNIYISVQYRDPSNVLKKKTAKFTKQ